jgi:hypothetical protein
MLVRKGECNGCGGCCNRAVTQKDWPKTRAIWKESVAKKLGLDARNLPDPPDLCPWLKVAERELPRCIMHDKPNYPKWCTAFPERPDQTEWMKAHGFECGYWFEDVPDMPSEMEVMGP